MEKYDPASPETGLKTEKKIRKKKKQKNTIVRYHLTLTSTLSKREKNKAQQVSKRMWRKGTPVHCVGEYKLVQSS